MHFIIESVHMCIIITLFLIFLLHNAYGCTIYVRAELNIIQSSLMLDDSFGCLKSLIFCA